MIQQIWQNVNNCRIQVVNIWVFTVEVFPLSCMFESFHNKNWTIKQTNRDFPGGAAVKNPPANAGDMGSSPGPGRSHMLRSS